MATYVHLMQQVTVKVAVTLVLKVLVTYSGFITLFIPNSVEIEIKPRVDGISTLNKCDVWHL